MSARTKSILRCRPKLAVRRCGATLIELLVVITLIGLLVGSLLPSVGKSMRVASDAICKHHLREIGHTFALYEMDNAGWLPTMGEPKFGMRDVRLSEPWFLKLFPTYLQDPASLTCPEDPFRFRMLELANNTTQDGAVSSEIEENDTSWHGAEFSSYGVNSFILTSGDGSLAQEGRRHPSRPLDTLLAADLGPDREYEADGSDTLFGPRRNASLLTWNDGFDPFDPDAPKSSWLTTRHGGKINAMTLGGGVRSVKTADAVRNPIQSYYADCAAGGCTFCNVLGVDHYSFAKDHLYWWTGPVLPE